MYSKWKKKTRREISAAGFGDDSIDSRPNPNYKVNSKVPNELNNADQIRKSRIFKENMKKKNMTKDKRTHLEGLARKKKTASRSFLLCCIALHYNL